VNGYYYVKCYVIGYLSKVLEKLAKFFRGYFFGAPSI